MELTPKDRSHMASQTIAWMMNSLIDRGILTSELEIQGHVVIEDYSIVLTVYEKSGAPPSRRRPVPNRLLARQAVSHEFLMGERPFEGAEAIDKVVATLSQHPHLLAHVTPEVTPDPGPPSEEDLEEVRQILEQSRARRDLRLAKRRDGGSGRSGRTTRTP